MVGSGAYLAEKVDSVNPGTTAIDVPRGIVTAWNNRFVIANGQSIFFSDLIAETGGDPRTFVVENQNSIQSTVFGLHVAAGGQLVVVTSGGVYGLDSGQAAVQVVAAGSTAWQKLHHHEATSLESSCVVNGRVWALTRRGYMLVDTENDQEVALDQALQPRYWAPRYALQDYRPARMYGGELGPIVSVDTFNGTHMHDLAHDLRSWWNSNPAQASWKVRGVLRGPDGVQMLMTQNSVLRMFGNFDGTAAISGAETIQPFGVLAGIMPTRPYDSPTVREIRVSAALCSATGSLGAHVAVRGDNQDAVAMDYDRNTDDVGIEFAVDEPSTRLLPVADLILSDSAPTRKTGRG